MVGILSRFLLGPGLFSGAMFAGFVSGGVDFRILLITYLNLTSHETRLQGCGYGCKDVDTAARMWNIRLESTICFNSFRICNETT